MAVLSAIFRGVDEMSSILDRMASSGEAAVTQWERAGSAANDAFSRATSSATGTAQASNSAASSADGLSDSFEANAQAADEAARSIGNIGEESEAAGIALVGENGPELINFGGGETVYTTEETNQILSAAGSAPMNVPAPEGLGFFGGESSGGNNVSEKKITLEIAGSGAIEVSGPFDEERLMGLLFSNLKPALMGLLKKEIYEEGDLSYEF